MFLLENSGLQSFTLFRSNTLKQIISDFDLLCTQNNYKIDYDTFDIKNFFTEVQKKHLIPRLFLNDIFYF